MACCIRLLHVTLKSLMSQTVKERVQKRREALRRAGLRPVQLWVPDTRVQGFAQECQRQSALVAQVLEDADLQPSLEASASTEGWTA